MATNEHYRDADQVSLPVPSGTGSGVPVLVNALPAVTLTAEGEGGNADDHATVSRKGAFRLDVDGEVEPGEPVYIDGSGALTATATDNDLFGYALEAKGSGSGVIPVAIAQV